MKARSRRSPSRLGRTTARAHDAVAALRAAYAHALPSRLRRLTLACRAWHRTPGDAELLERARALAHRLRGTAGSYGFPAVGLAAGRIEEAASRGAWDEIASALREAEALAADAIRQIAGDEGGE